MVAKMMAVFGVLLISGSLTTASEVGDSAQRAPLSDGAPIIAVSEHETLQTDSDAVALAISNEEAVRREKICDKLRDNCLERCINWKLKGKKLSDCRDMCNANWDDCIADIK